MDEVHYLADRFRGAVWEEVIIHLPESVRLVSLSATVSNAEEFGDWLEHRARRHHGRSSTSTGPVPLWQHVLVGSRLYDLFTRPPEGDRRRRHGAGSERRAAGQPGAAPAGPRERAVAAAPGRRRGRGDAAPTRGRAGLRCPPRPERHRAPRPGRPAAGDHVHLQPGRLRRRGPAVPGRRAAADHDAERGRRITRRSRAAHRRHPGAPTCTSSATGSGSTGCSAASPRITPGCCRRSRRSVEELFAAGLVKAVFATETLALGINMPARSVVLERLVKWNGETHADLTAGGVHPAHRPGRAARHRRRGSRRRALAAGLDPEARRRARRRPAPIRCAPRSARPTTWRSTWSARSAGSRPQTLLESSFAQFQADRAVVGLARQARRGRQALDDLTVTCDRGDFAEYDELRKNCPAWRARRPGSAGRRGAVKRCGRWSNCAGATSSGRPAAGELASRSSSILASPARRPPRDLPLPLVLTPSLEEAAPASRISQSR